MPDTAGGPTPVAVVIPARDEAERVAATIRAVRRIPGVVTVIVVDDGSRDGTARVAAESGAEVVRHARNRGKAHALMSGLDRMAALQRAGRVEPRAAVLFVDADLEDSAEAVGALVGPVTAGEADLTIATLPPQRTPGGGRGLVVGLARRGIAELTGWTPVQPLSGMRCLSPAAVGAATPFARGWGVEVGMTIDVLDAGLVVREVPCDLHHRVTGTDWRAQLHRAGQYRDVALALSTRRLRRRFRRSPSESAT
ncbi:glycosyltransferase family 2 protein [Intrasporangium sp.]|uniref:glycosyltransferase family 2 protein n=1 Tax=Intrasporangium sp. TaxID=1925024 RepID=UPI00293A416E|nr:glycosyltransferase family 2 protein [Intrasporangium sp.]MDV3221047.1 glycosyltransferase family 2 protein [Intrasporangium sp.]